MKFIHFADAHLDSPFRGLSFLPSTAFKKIYTATNESLDRIVTLALKEKVDLVLIAGDTFDSAKPSPHSQLFFAKEIKRLTDARIQVVMIFGNHDHMRREDLLIAPSPYFKLLGANEKVEKASFEAKDGFTYTVSGFSYLNNHILSDKVPNFPAKDQCYTFGLMHAQEKTSVASQNVYAPFTRQELRQLNYDYFALGHIHLRQIVSQQPLIVYPGNIQGRHVGELGAKGCYLGVIDEDTKVTHITFVPTSPILWQQKKLKLSRPLSKNELQAQIVNCLKDAQQLTYFSLQISNAQYLSLEEGDLVQDSDFWQTISAQLPHASQLVDVRFTSNEEILLQNSDQDSFIKAREEVFAPAEFKQLSASWSKKSDLTARLAADPSFRKSVEDLAEVKLASRLKGMNDAPAENQDN